MFRVTLALMAMSFSGFFSLFIASAHADEVHVAGSTSVARLMDVLAEQYNQEHPKDYVAVQGVGSTAGVTLVKKRVADIGMSSRYLTESEQDQSMSVHIAAFDGLAVVVNNANPVSNVTREQLFDIYKGKLTNWKQLGGPDLKIAVVTREASSGSRYSFESLLGLTKVVNERLVSDINPNNLVVNSNSMVKTIVNHNKQAIGFVSYGSVDKSVKAINFEGVKASSETIENGQYELARPFLIFYLTDSLSESADKFVQFLKSSQVDTVITEYGYTPAQ